MKEASVRQIVREELRQLDENSLSAGAAQKAREKIEREVEPALEKLVGVAKAQGAKPGWAESILEDAKDLYQELSDHESSMRAQGTKMPGY